MSLSADLISQFVKATKDEEPASKEATVLGTTVEYNGKIYVKLDGSDLLTPVSSTADTKADERVTVLIKNHTATVTGNMSSPSARTDDVKDVASQISEFEIVIAHRVTTEELSATTAVIENLKATLAKLENIDAVYAEIETLESMYTNTEYLTAKEIDAINAQIERIEATFGDFTDISTEDLEAINADIGSLKAYTADFTYVSTEVLDAVKASIKQLETDKLSVKEADIKYASIDFSNIGELAVQKIFADSGIIKDIIVSEGKITGELVGVTIKGDLIEGSTIKADKLVVKGSDGIYYKLNVEAGATTSEEVTEEELQNGLHGTAIIAKTITAEKIAVDDLVAFDATIGGFKITDSAIYSGVKESATNTTRGIYLDNEGQLSVGDTDSYLKYYKDSDGNYKLAISASEIYFSSTGKSIEESIDIEVGARNLIRNSENFIFNDYYFSVADNIETIDDGDGHVTWVAPRLNVTDNGLGDIDIENDSLNIEDDDMGNVMLYTTRGNDVENVSEMKTLTIGDTKYEIVDQVARDRLDRMTTATIGEVELRASRWVGTSSPYSQIVYISGVTENSQVNLTPDVQQLSIFYEKDLTFVTENDGGVVTVYAIGQKPQNDYTIQVTIMEVSI